MQATNATDIKFLAVSDSGVGASGNGHIERLIKYIEHKLATLIKEANEYGAAKVEVLDIKYSSCVIRYRTEYSAIIIYRVV